MNARRLLVWVLIVGGILLAAVVGSRRADQGLPLDPSSPGQNGTKALVETLRALGAKVSVSSELPSDGGTALLLADNLSEQRRARLLDWVRRGGTLVVADPSSRVTRVEPIGDTRIGLLDAELEPTCALPAVRDVRRVSAPGGIVFRVPAGAQGCFPRGHGAWLGVQPTGSGTVVRLGGASALVNQRINRTDNAVLIVDLLSPAPGPEVVVLRPPPPGGGSKGLSDLIAPRVRLPAGTPPEQVAETVAVRTGIDRERVLAALQPPTPRDDAALVALGQAIDTIRTAVSSAHGAR